MCGRAQIYKSIEDGGDEKAVEKVGRRRCPSAKAVEKGGGGEQEWGILHCGVNICWEEQQAGKQDVYVST